MLKQYIDKPILRKVITIAIILIALYFIYYGYKKYKYWKNLPEEINIPDDDPFKPVTPGSTPSITFNPQPLTDKLYKDISGWAFFNNYEPWQQLSALSDSDIVKIMNDWDKRYYNVWNETLYQAFSGETRYSFNAWFQPSSFLGVLKTRLERLESLRTPL